MATFGQGIEGQLVTVDISTNNTGGTPTTVYTCPADRTAVILFASYIADGTAQVTSLKRISAFGGTGTTSVNIVTNGSTSRLTPFTADPNIAASDYDNRILMPQDTVRYQYNNAAGAPQCIIYIFEYF